MGKGCIGYYLSVTNSFLPVYIKMELRVSMAEWAFFVLQAVFELIAIVFLYTKENNEWFNSRTTNTLP